MLAEGGDGAEDAAGLELGLITVAQDLGVTGLFRGTQARLLQMIVIVVVQLLVYDSVKSFVGLPVTGAR